MLNKTFLTFYIQKLSERSQAQKERTIFGFDWIIYNLSLTDNYTPVRLPFIRNGGAETSKTKSEAEFGVDMSFISDDKKTLRVFVLKAEVLTNNSWGSAKFRDDLDDACDVSTESDPDLKHVEVINVILAYNKDEYANGIKKYDLSKAKLERRDERLKIERWNLTKIVNEASDKLLNPSLLPQKFYSQFSYICSQFENFRHGSEEWEKQLVPNWRNFLDSIFTQQIDERTLNIVPVALLILRAEKDKYEGRSTGFIDLTEWAMMKIFDLSLSNEKISNLVLDYWYQFYFTILNDYYSINGNLLTVQDSLDVTNIKGGFFVGPMRSATVAQWHVARIGLLSLCCAEMASHHNNSHDTSLKDLADLFTRFSNANKSAQRVFLDIHIIQVLLTYYTYFMASDVENLLGWLHRLCAELKIRRLGLCDLQFIYTFNNESLAIENYALKNTKNTKNTSSSSLVMILAGLINLLPASDDKNELLKIVHNNLILGEDDFCKKSESTKQLNLFYWVPPQDWEKRIFNEPLANEGIAVQCEITPTASNNFKPEEFTKSLNEFTSITMKHYTEGISSGLPISA